MLQNESFYTGVEILGNEYIPNRPDLSIVNLNYFTTSDSGEFYEEWLELIDTKIFMVDIATEQPFKITLSLQYAQFMEAEDDLNIAKVILGIQDNHKTYRNCIEFGIYMGRLFIEDKFDAVSVDKEYLVEGVRLVLTVHPMENGKSSAVLNVVSECGLVLSSLISKKFAFADWKGEISPGAHFKSLIVEDVQNV